MTKETLFNTLGVFFALYLLGFAWCMAEIMAGGSGTDALSQHYKTVISLFIN